MPTVVWCRFLIDPSCIKKRKRGAPPGKPHKRRQRPQISTSSPVTSVIVSAQSCVTPPVTVTTPFCRSSYDLSPVLVAVPGANEFSVERLKISAGSRASSTSLSSVSSVDSCDMMLLSRADISLPCSLPPPLAISYRLVDNVVCWCNTNYTDTW